MKENNIKDYYALQQYYRDRARKLLRTNKKAVYWTVNNTFDVFSYAAGDIVEYWGNSATIA